MKRNYLSIGTISEGTLRDEDLIDAFDWTLRHLNKRTAAHLAHQYRDWQEDDEVSPEIASEYIDALTDALNDYAPPYTYVGSTDGDGACFGCWVDYDAVDMAIKDKDILAINDFNDIPRKYRGCVLESNDHGNMTMYYCNAKGKLRAMWSCV
jgi:hypothetical protein